jgi:uncharacterized membrane protein
MIQALRQLNRLHTTLLLLGFSLLCFALSVFRFVMTDTKVFLFLNWNLFLAFVPWVFSTYLILHPRMQSNRWVVALLFGIWLVFFPNAPYILTDLFHLRLQSGMPIWFDLVLILSFAWTGLLYGFFSLYDMEFILARWFGKRGSVLVSMILLFLGSFGIYLGRYLRWNSWDIIQKPFSLMYDVSDRIINPLDHPRTWGMTFFMWLFMLMIYWTFKVVRNRSQEG